MERKSKKYTKKEYNLISTINTSVTTAAEAQNSCVIPTTNTSMAPAIAPPLKSMTKDAAGINQYQMPYYRNTRQHANNAILQQKAKANTNTETEMIATQRQTATVHKNHHNNPTVMNSKAAACIASQMEQLAAVHAKATSSRNKNEEAINDLKTRIPEIENIFDIHSRIGNGTFSTVLLGTLKKQRDLPENLKRKYAIKHHIPTSHPDRIMKELQCMAKIGGTDNVVGINCCIRCNESVAFIMPYLAHDRFHDFYNKMDVAEVQFYMKNLLIALRHVHRFNVIHRDVKPSNFLYNRRKKQFLLVDFGLAQQVAATTNNNNLAVVATSKKVVSSGGEGKRFREHDDDDDVDKNAKIALEGAASITEAGEVVSGTAKRLRCVPPEQMAQQQPPPPTTHVSTGPTTRAAHAANASSVAQTPFKMPLKQINDIDNNSAAVTAKTTAASGCSSASVGERKPEGVTNAHNLNSRLQQKLRAQQVGNESVRTSSAGVAKSTVAPNNQTVNANINNNNNNININNNNNNNSNSDAKYNTTRSLSTSNSPKCYCYGNPHVCNICLVKKEIHASRAGTPGYRPPEVLLKYPDQTTAVDIWAAGVIFLSVLSSVYPFFKAPNDYVALAEMITIFGDKTIRKTAYVLDRLVTLSQKTKPLDLRKLCVRFRNRAKFSSPELLKKHQRPDGTCEVCKNCDQFFFNCLCLESGFATESLDEDDMFPPSAYDLLYRLLEINPHKRLTADEALRHPFFLGCPDNNNDNITTSNATVSPVTTSLAVNQIAALPLNTPPISLEAAGDSLKKF